MFEQKKKKNKNKIFYLFLIVLISFGYWLNTGLQEEDNWSKEENAPLSEVSSDQNDDAGNTLPDDTVVNGDKFTANNKDTGIETVGPSWEIDGEEQETGDMEEDSQKNGEESANLLEEGSKENNSSLEEKVDELNNPNDRTNEKATKKICYFALAVNDFICIYKVNESGEKTLLRQTEIRFGTLSKADQAMFRNGVNLYSESELNELLQDFES